MVQNYANELKVEHVRAWLQVRRRLCTRKLDQASPRSISLELETLTNSPDSLGSHHPEIGQQFLYEVNDAQMQ